MVVGHISAKSREYRAVLYVNLPIRLGMICICKGAVRTHHLENDLEGLRDEAVAVVRDEVLWWTVIKNPRIYKTSYEFYGGLTLQRDCLHELGESVVYH